MSIPKKKIKFFNQTTIFPYPGLLNYKLGEFIRSIRVRYFVKAIPYSGKQIIWIKTPKCGGTSMKNILEDIGYLSMMRPSKKPIIGVYAGRIEEFKVKYPQVWKESWKFSVVRNPYDKFVSGWKYLRSTKDRELKDVLLSPPSKEKWIHDWKHLTRTQSQPLIDEEGKLVTDRIIHFESLEEGLNTILEEFGLPPVKLPSLNKTKGKSRNYEKYYDQETRKLLEERYAKDFELFEFEKI